MTTLCLCRIQKENKSNLYSIGFILENNETTWAKIRFVWLVFLKCFVELSCLWFGSTERKITLLNSWLNRFFQIIRYYLVLLLTLTNVKQHTDIFKVTIFTRIVQICWDFIIHNHRAIKLILKTIIVWKGITRGFRTERMIGWKYQHVKGPKHHSIECSSHSRKSCL